MLRYFGTCFVSQLSFSFVWMSVWYFFNTFSHVVSLNVCFLFIYFTRELPLKLKRTSCITQISLCHPIVFLSCFVVVEILKSDWEGGPRGLRGPSSAELEPHRRVQRQELICFLPFCSSPLQPLCLAAHSPKSLLEEKFQWRTSMLVEKPTLDVSPDTSCKVLKY